MEQRGPDLSPKAFAFADNSCMTILAVPSSPVETKNEQGHVVMAANSNPMLTLFSFSGATMLTGRQQITTLMEACAHALNREVK